MTTSPIEQPRDHAGKFAPYRADEAQVELTLVVSPGEAEHEHARALYKIGENLVAWRTRNGFTTPEPTEQVRAAMRAEAPHLSEADFEARFADVTAAAAVVHRLEDALEDPWETSKWQDVADDFCLEASDFPVPAGEWEPGDAHTDWRAYCEAVSEEASTRYYDAVLTMARADLAARGS